MRQALALKAFWEHTPPPAVQLRRIALALGLKMPAAPAQTKTTDPADAIREAGMAGLGVSYGRPDDPMLDFLDI